MTESRRNSYEDDDLAAVLSEIETLEAAKVSIMAKAAGDCAGVAGKIKVLKKQAKDDLGIPLQVLNPLLKRRKFERKIADLDDNVEEDFAEVWEDACGQFAMFAPVEQAEDESVN